jgi:outer membrane scaffolding protein for murein synthesis (MipA/OmpV family)
LQLSATTLLGDAKNSPIVYHTTQPVGLVTVAYRF